MEVIIEETEEQVGRLAAEMIAQQLLRKPNSVLGLATGSTPVGTYRELVRMHREQGLDFSQAVTFNLDEYLGLPPTHPQSYHHFMNEHLLNHVNIPRGNIHVPYGHALAVQEFCDWYECEIVRCGGIDLQLLGVGTDGHIGFNEPGSSLGSRTRLKTLTEETVRDNARFFSSVDEVPRFAITMGVGTILEARKILLLAYGARKAATIAAAIEGPVTAQVTASALQLHRNVTVLVDAQAAGGLTRSAYYRWVREQKARLLPQLHTSSYQAPVGEA
jgi:glucosamine-6-phosphate deaminase